MPALRPLLLLSLPLALPPFLLRGALAKSPYGKPSLPEVSATCAAVEFTFSGEGDLSQVYIFAKRPRDSEFVQWGAPLLARRVLHTWNSLPTYRVLMRNIPPGETFRVKVSSRPSLSDSDESAASSSITMLEEPTTPAKPSSLELHRSDPRLNAKRHDESVCIDLHWSHPHPTLRNTPSDVQFRIQFSAVGEPESVFCQDEVGKTTRSCGQPLASVKSALPSSYATICGLRPNRTLRFSVEAVNCDLQPTAAQLESVTPPSAPDFVMNTVTRPLSQESIAGFHPMAVLDWVPQNDPLIEGHAIYLGLADVSSMKLLCWVPRNHPGHLELPVVQRNFTHSQADLLVQDYWNKHHVHQEQELRVATRTSCLANGVKKGYLESPTSTCRLGDWLVMEETVKCLTSFESTYPEYVERPVTPTLTQEQAFTMYD